MISVDFVINYYSNIVHILSNFVNVNPALAMLSSPAILRIYEKETSHVRATEPKGADASLD